MSVYRTSVSRVLIAFAVLVAATLHAAPLETTFTYQGELRDGGAPANGSYDFEFELYDAVSNGGQRGESVLIEDVTVTDGVFTVELDFGAEPFAGDQLWLEIGIRGGVSTGGFTGLLPRQKLTAVPYALHAEMVAANAIAGAEIANNSVTAADLAVNSVAASEIAANAVGQSELAANSVGSSEVINNSLTAADLANNSVTAAELAANSVGASEIITAQVQRRVAGSCEPGTYLSGVNENGSVQCSALPVGLARNVDTGDVGRFSSIAIREDGLPLISYSDDTDRDLKVFACTNAVCSRGSIRTLDSSGDVGRGPSLALRGNGLPMIAYVDRTNVALKVYDCSNASCSAGTARTVVAGSTDEPSLAVRQDGRPLISYYALSGTGTLMVFDCNDTACSNGTTRALDSVGDVGRMNSLTVRADGRPMVSYYDRTNENLKVFDCANVACSSGSARVLQDIDLVFGGGTSIAVRPDGFPIIAYQYSTGGTNPRLGVYDCANTACSSGDAWERDTRASRPSIAIRSSGLPIVSYVDTTIRALGFLSCTNPECSRGIEKIVDAADTSDTSMAIRPNGLPIVSYHGVLSSGLNIFSCGNASCTQ